MAGIPPVRSGARPSQKMGVPPGTLVHVGRAREGAVQFEVHRFDGAGELERAALPSVDAIADVAGRPGLLWVDVNGVHDTEAVARLGAMFDLHPLLLEDVVHTHQRPKAEVHGSHLFLVLKMILPGEEPPDIEVEQVSVVVGTNFVLTFQERARDTFDPVRRRLADPSSRLRGRGPDFLAYALVDTIVDGYFAVLEDIGDRFEALEDDVLASPDSDTLERVYGVKRTLTELRRVLWPLRDAVAALGRGDTGIVQESTHPYLRDLQDHVIRVIETVETYRDTAATLLEMYMSSVSNRLNEVMRVLTVIATIFIPLSFLVGVYGMNFTNMPELGWRWGYPAVWAVMGATAGGLLLFFRRRGWL